jgi:glutamine synthetase
MTPAEVIEFAKKNGVKMVDLKFIDLPGMWQHFTIPLHQLQPARFAAGGAFKNPT